MMGRSVRGAARETRHARKHRKVRAGAGVQGMSHAIEGSGFTGNESHPLRQLHLRRHGVRPYLDERLPRPKSYRR